MKTAISVPNETFDAVEPAAARLGISRSQFYSRAAQRWVDELDDNGLTAEIDASLEGDRYNASGLRTVTVVTLTSNPQRAAQPGNVTISAEIPGAERDSVANVTQVATIDIADLVERVGTLPTWVLEQIDAGLRRALSL